MSYSMIVGIMKIWALLAKNVTLKPASQYLNGALAVLVRYNQAQKCQPKTLPKSCYDSLLLLLLFIVYLIPID